METANSWIEAHDLRVPPGEWPPFFAAIRSSGMAMVIVDPNQPDQPIIFANPAFLRLTGYSWREVAGRNCRFLQGAGTDEAARRRIRAAIDGNKEIAIDLLNYRKDGSSFWNSLYISPVFDEQGERRYFFASQFDVSERKRHEIEAAELRDNLEHAVRLRTLELESALERSQFLLHEVDHRVKNNLQMISAMLMLQSMTIADGVAKRTLQEMLERIDALGLVHKRLYQSGDMATFDIGEFTRAIVGQLAGGSGGQARRVDLDIESVKVRTGDAASLALIINELLAPALKSPARVDGGVDLAVSVRAEGDAVAISVRDAAAGAAMPWFAAAFGKTLAETLARQLRATIMWRNADGGAAVEVTMPLGETRRDGDRS